MGHSGERALVWNGISRPDFCSRGLLHGWCRRRRAAVAGRPLEILLQFRSLH